MQRPGSVTGRQTRNQGIGNRPDNQYDRNLRLKAIFQAAIADELDAGIAYKNLSDEIKLAQLSATDRASMIEVIEHIKSQESCHLNLLKQLYKRI